MATIQEISQGSNYQGNAALGGFAPKAIDIDNKPLQTLAAYTVMFNKNQYDQRQKDTDEKIKELATLSQYNILGARGKDKEEAINTYEKLQEAMREFAMMGVPKSPQQKLQQELEVKTKTKETIDKINSLNARGIAYDKRLNDIKINYSDPKIREIKTKQLEDEFNSTDWQTPIGSEEKFTAILPTIGAASTRSSTSNKTVGNQIVQQRLDIFVPSDNMNQSSVEALGFDRLSILPPNATEAEKRNFELQQASGGQAKILNEATALFNKAISDDKYKVNGVIDYNLIIQDNPMLGSFIKGIDAYNAYADELTADINNGVFKTTLGKEIPLGGVIELKDVFKIDKNKKLETKDLIFIEKFLSAPPKKEVEEKIIETNEQLSKDDNAREWFNARTSRINANKPSGSSGGGGDTPSYIKDPAILMKKHMENVLNKFKGDPTALAGGNFAVNVSSVDSSTKKALGIEATDNNKVVIYYKNGSIRVADGQVMKNRKIMNNNAEVDLNTSSKLYTLGDLKTGYISVVKAGTPEASQTEGFQKSAEAYFDAELGTNNMQLLYDEAYKEIVDGVAPATTTPAKTPAPATGKGAIKGFDAQGNPIYK